MALTAPERETTVISTDGDDLVTVETAQRRYLTRLRKNARFLEVAQGEFEGSEWARFTIPASEWNPATGAKRKRSLTDEQRGELRDRLANARTHRGDAPVTATPGGTIVGAEVGYSEGR